MDESRLPPHNSTPSSRDDELQKLCTLVAQLTARVEALEARQPIVAAPIARATEMRTESRFGLTFVNRAGALTLALGIIFFFKYAVDNRWIGTDARVFIGVLAGIAMLAGAEWLRSRDRQAAVFTNGLAVCGLATIYAAAYAAYGYYELIVPAAAWIFLVLISALTVTVSVRYTSAAIAALGFLGALLTPMLLQNKAIPWWSNFFYFLMISGCALAISARQHWVVLVPLLTGFTLIAAGFSLQAQHPGWFVILAFLLAAMHFAAARRFGTYPYLTGHGALLVGVMCLVALWADARVGSVDRFSFISALESVLLGAYGIGALAYGITRSSAVNRALGLVLVALVIAKLYLWDVWQLSTFYRVSAFVLLGVLLLAASYFYSRFRSRSAE